MSAHRRELSLGDYLERAIRKVGVLMASAAVALVALQMLPSPSMHIEGECRTCGPRLP